MGLTSSSTGLKLTKNDFNIVKRNEADKILAIAGNPNVGKSTLFNGLTGMRQHTGNWPGKTVANAQGYCKTKENSFVLVDIPGTYSLLANSAEEEIARNFICFNKLDGVVIVCDATCLERNLNLVLQTKEITDNIIVCVNLLDEARRKGIEIDLEGLSRILGVKVVGTVARSKKSLKALLNSFDSFKGGENNEFYVKYPEPIENAIAALSPVLEKKIKSLPARWLSVSILSGDTSLIDEITRFLNFNPLEDEEISKILTDTESYLKKEGIRKEIIKDMIASATVLAAESIAKQTVKFKGSKYGNTDRKIDKLLTSRLFGYPIMILLLCFVFWLTIRGANYFSEALSLAFNFFMNKTEAFLIYIKLPNVLTDFIVNGVLKVPLWVISVMLPPMAIFFPLFTLLEDAGFLPRIAFNLDKPFKRCKSCGKQALTMCMGFGCNAAGVIGCRIIDSPRERLLGIITNSLVPCNGRFPAIIALISMFFVTASGFLGGITSALVLTLVILLGIIITFISTKFLSSTLLKGVPSAYVLELPPYRKPQIMQVLIRSVFDRTIFVLGRSVTASVPAGIIIWVLANIMVGSGTLLDGAAQILDPIGKFMGLDGVILLAFILGFPANEIVVPIILMSYLSQGSLIELSSFAAMKEVLVANGWNILTALNTIIFFLFHWPCSTTLITIKKETGSMKWTLLSAALPTAIGFIICVTTNLIFTLTGVSLS